MNITRWTRFVYFKVESGKCEDRRIFRLDLILFPGKYQLRLIHVSWNNAAMKQAVAAAVLRAKGA